MRARLPAAGLLAVLLAATATARGHAPRQFYSAWSRHPAHKYHFRHLYFKPHAEFVGFRHHYVIFFPHRPKHLFFFNPYSRTYWGRCPAQRDGTAAYSLLAPKDRKGKLADIPEAAFPDPGDMPPLPESTDGTKLDLPPDDLPDEPTPTDK